MFRADPELIAYWKKEAEERRVKGGKL